MAYLNQDTQPERTALAWTRTSLALFVATIWVCRLAFVGQSSAALVVLLASVLVMATNFFLLKSRRGRLDSGIESSTGTGAEKLLVVFQMLLLSIAALL